MSAIPARTRIDKVLPCHNHRTKRVIKLVVDQQSGIGRDARTAERRLEAAIKCSPRSPEITIRIFSSEEYCLRALRRISLTCCSAPQFGGVCFAGLILVSFAVTMSRKHSGKQTIQIVLRALTANRRDSPPVHAIGGLPRRFLCWRPLVGALSSMVRRSRYMPVVGMERSQLRNLAMHLYSIRFLRPITISRKGRSEKWGFSFSSALACQRGK
jgi:hypothetical protein